MAKRIGVGIVALMFLVLGTGLIVRSIAIQRAERDFPPPGRLVEVDGRLSHVQCSGVGSPVIVLEAGLDNQGSTTWTAVRPEIARISRTCGYDRAGFMWSERGREPRDAHRIADELHELLDAAGEAPPYVMVGHSLGGLYVRVYDHRYPGEVAGFVLVDPSHPDQQERFPAAVQERIREMNDDPPRWILRFFAPFRLFAPERSTPRAAYFWRSFPEGVASEVDAMSTIMEQAQEAGPMGDRPLVVLTSGEPVAMSGLPDSVNVALDRVLRELKFELGGLSTNADHRVVDAGHYIHRDCPEAVTQAVRDVVNAVRGTGTAPDRELR